jgi:hypothetical protein
VKKILGSTLALLLFFSSVSSAGMITGGTYLDDAGANQLEAWLGVGDQDFTNIYSGGVGASAASFHAAADGAGPTFSIYEMTIHDGSTNYIGGYTVSDWAGGGYVFDATAFIFNLTSGEVQYQVSGDSYAYGRYSTYRNPTYFPTFGGGHDISGHAPYGLGIGNGSDYWDGYTYSYTYQHSKGQISVFGDAGAGHGNSGYRLHLPDITGLQVYTIAEAKVPEPSIIALFAAGLFGLGFARRKVRS